jgi:hypothetical protein
VSGSLPGIVCELDFMTGGAKLRCGGTHHGVVSDAEDGKSDNDADNDENRWLDQLFPSRFLSSGSIGCHVPSNNS